MIRIKPYSSLGPCFGGAECMAEGSIGLYDNIPRAEFATEASKELLEDLQVLCLGSCLQVFHYISLGLYQSRVLPSLFSHSSPSHSYCLSSYA